MHDSYVAKGVLKKDTIEGISQTDEGGTNRWQLARQLPDMDVRGPKPKK